MARVRSPNYPALSLPEAIKSATAIQAAEQHLAAPKEVVAKHLGYASLHGHAGRAISAIENYGLLEEVNGDKVKVSQLAMSILFPASPEEKQSAIKEAAFKHPLFMAIQEEWQGSRPSDENLRVYLIRRKFAADALDRVIEVYKATMDLVTLDSGVYAAPNHDPKGRQDREFHKMQPAQHQAPSMAAQSVARGAFPPEEIKAFVASQLNRATLTLEEGTAVLEIPAAISKRSHNALKLWLELMLKLAEADSPSSPSS
jgi:hypothetical protein